MSAKPKRRKGVNVKNTAVSVDVVSMAAIKKFMEMENCNFSQAVCGMVTAFAVNQPALEAAIKEVVEAAVLERLAESGWSPGLSQMLSRELTGGPIGAGRVDARLEPNVVSRVGGA